MRNIGILLFFICSFILLQSCSDDETLENKEFLIEYHISCDNPDAQMHIDANGLDPKGVYVKNTYKNGLNTKSYFAVVDVKCDDPKAVVFVELYVNNKLRVTKNGNSTVFISERLKGKGPYLE